MEKLLLLVHRIPYPPDKGDKIRSHHLLQHLCRHYQVHLGAFVDDAVDWQHVPRLQAQCAASHFVGLHPLWGRVRSLRALARGRALSYDYYRDRSMGRWVDATIAREGIRRVMYYSSPMAQYAASGGDTCRVADLVDVDSEKWREYAAGQGWLMRQLYQREARRLLDHERAIARATDAALFVSAPEAQLFRAMAPESALRIAHYSNGVDGAFFSPFRPYPSPYPAQARVLAFTGAMDYRPNIEAVDWFARAVLPAILKCVPEVWFYIVGARPVALVKRLATLRAVKVTGSVPDIRPYLAHAALCVAPMRIARGIQNKVLEAMAMARPVLVTAQALEGIDAQPGSELLLAHDEGAWVQAVLDHLRKPDNGIGPAARKRVLQSYDWERNLATVSALLERTPQAATRQSA